MVSNRYSDILHRELTSAERLGDAFANIEFAKRYLVQLENRLKRLPNDLTNAQLETIDDAVRQMLHALENAVFLGYSGYDPWGLKTVEWERKD